MTFDMKTAMDVTPPKVKPKRTVREVSFTVTEGELQTIVCALWTEARESEKAARGVADKGDTRTAAVFQANADECKTLALRMEDL